MQDFKTLADFLGVFRNEKVCRKHFEKIRFANGDFCPHCKHNKVMRFSDGLRYRCHSCRKDFTIKTRTIFGESKIPLQKWFVAIYLLTTRKKGISSIELSKAVGVSQKTAWFMDHRIREALKQGGGKLSGIVEVDETYVGGKHRRRFGFSKKQPVLGMTERGGRIRAFTVPNRETHIILGQVLNHIDKKAHLMTDDAGVYRKLERIGYKHNSVKHSRKQYVLPGGIHTNSIESFWATFKRQFYATHHAMAKKHLQRYLDEIVFRHNNKKLSTQEIFNEVTKLASTRDNMSYKRLIEHEKEGPTLQAT